MTMTLTPEQREKYARIMHRVNWEWWDRHPMPDRDNDIWDELVPIDRHQYEEMSTPVALAAQRDLIVALEKVFKGEFAMRAEHVGNKRFVELPAVLAVIRDHLPAAPPPHEDQ